MRMMLQAAAGAAFAVATLAVAAGAQTQAQPPDPAEMICPRPSVGSLVQAPPELRSADGLLEVTLHLRTVFTMAKQQRYCYRVTMPDGEEAEAPTLRVHPGDTLLIHFANDISTEIHPQTAIPRAEHPDSPHAGSAQPPHDATMPAEGLPSAANPADAPCFAMAMSATGSNLHFHGLSVSPTCHQDDVIHTLVRSGQTFDYRLRIPRDEPPGLYWYHPHPHGYSEEQVLGGASGALIVEPVNATGNSGCPMSGFSDMGPCLPERTLILRDQIIAESTLFPHGEHAGANATEAPQPVWDVSLNFVPVLYPAYMPARLEVPAQQRELWRVLNASADLIVDLEYVVNGKPQQFSVRGIDGVPLSAIAAGLRADSVTHLLLPPGARAEVIAMTPPAGAHAELRTRNVDTGPDGELEPARPIAEIITPSSRTSSRENREDEAKSRSHLPSYGTHSPTSTSAKAMPPAYQRRLYFSEQPVIPGDKESYTNFMLTVEGQPPHPYVMGQSADITVHRGAVEEWTIENRTREVHVFHIHQLHFQVVAQNGIADNDATQRDTIEVPYWSGSGAYPSVRVRLDFSSRDIVGSFMYHCHILGHEDAGMMGGIDVLPEGLAAQVSLVAGPLVAARVSSVANGTAPTGTVQFQQAGQVLGEAKIIHGEAKMETVYGFSGTEVEAIYSGDRYFSASSTKWVMDNSTPTPAAASH